MSDPRADKSERVAAAFHVLRQIKQTVDETAPEPFLPTVEQAADRELADALLAGARGHESRSGALASPKASGSYEDLDGDLPGGKKGGAQ